MTAVWPDCFPSSFLLDVFGALFPFHDCYKFTTGRALLVPGLRHAGVPHFQPWKRHRWFYRLVQKKRHHKQLVLASTVLRVRRCCYDYYVSVVISWTFKKTKEGGHATATILWNRPSLDRRPAWRHKTQELAVITST